MLVSLVFIFTPFVFDFQQTNERKENIPTFIYSKIQQGATVCRYLFTAKLLYMFRVSIAPITRST